MKIRRLATRRQIKNLLLQTHLWLGLTVGGVLAIVGLTGAIYIFSPEIEAWGRNQRIKQDAHLPLLTPVQVVRALEAQGERNVTFFAGQRRAEDAYKVSFLEEKGRTYFVNPHTAEIIDLQEGRNFFDFIIDIHMSLAMGQIGMWITGSSSLILCFLLITTGIYLWWPRKLNRSTLRQRFSIEWKANWKRLNQDLHSVGGFYVHAIIGLLAFTGAYFTFPRLITTLVSAVLLSPTQPASRSAPAAAPQPDAESITFIEALERAEQLVPEYKLMGVSIPAKPGAPIRIQKHNIHRIQAGPYIRTYSYIDRYTGELLATYDPRELPRGQRLISAWQRQIHYGEVGGLATRILAMICSLFLPVLYVTGIIIWWKRRRKQPQPKGTVPAKKSAAKPAASEAVV